MKDAIVTSFLLNVEHIFVRIGRFLTLRYIPCYDSAVHESFDPVPKLSNSRLTRVYTNMSNKFSKLYNYLANVFFFTIPFNEMIVRKGRKNLKTEKKEAK